MTVKQGWTGRVFEDFVVGDVYEHPLGRTVIEADGADPAHPLKGPSFTDLSHIGRAHATFPR